MLNTCYSFLGDKIINIDTTLTINQKKYLALMYISW